MGVEHVLGVLPGWYLPELAEMIGQSVALSSGSSSARIQYSDRRAPVRIRRASAACAAEPACTTETAAMATSGQLTKLHRLLAHGVGHRLPRRGTLVGVPLSERTEVTDERRRTWLTSGSGADRAVLDKRLPKLTRAAM